jgi:hypothetical protein
MHGILDGSVRYLTDSVDRSIYVAVYSRDGREVVEMP